MTAAILNSLYRRRPASKPTRPLKCRLPEGWLRCLAIRSPPSMSLRIHNTLDPPTRRLRADRAGPCAHVRLRHDGLRPVPHRPCAHDDGLRRGAALAAGAAATASPTCATSPTSTTRSSSARVERGMTIRALTDEMIGAMHDDIAALGIEPPDARAARHRLRAADARPDRHARSARAWPTAATAAT